MLKLVRGLIFAALVAGFAGSALAQAKDSVIIVMRLEPAPGLDVTTGAAAAIAEVTAYNIFENLVRIDEAGNVKPMLAKSWTIGADGITYTFELLQGVKFHDGADFTAADVKFTFERNAGEKSTNKHKAFFQQVEAIDTPDPYKVVLRLKGPNSLFLDKMAQAESAIVSPATAANNATNPIGTGPYKFVRWTKGDSVDLEKFPGHRDAAKIKIAKVKFRFITDAAAQTTAMLAGDVDYITNFGVPEQFKQFQTDPRFDARAGTTEGETILTMNNQQKALSDVRVRRALMHAIDRKALIEGAQAGYGTPIGSHFAPHHRAYLDLTGQYPFDPKRARALLKEAGYDNNLELSLKLPPPEYARRGGEIIAAMLADVGVKAKLENVEWAQWLDAVFSKKQYDLTVISHVEPMDMGAYANPNYYYQYDNAEFRDLWKKVEAATTPADQDRALQAAQRKLADDAVNGFLFEFAKLGVSKKGLKGWWANQPAFLNYVAEMYWE